MTRSFDKMYSGYQEIKERVVTYSVSCAEKLRKQNSCCNSIMVFVHTNWFREDLPQYFRNIVIRLPYATNSSIELAKFATKGLDSIFKEGYQYKKAGVIVMDIVSDNERQMSLFENSNPKHRKLMKAVDYLNSTIGHQKVKLASQDFGRTWKMRQEKLSPRYTTKLDEIITIKAS